MEEAYTISELDAYTDFYRINLHRSVQPDYNNAEVPSSIFKYKPVTWEADPGIWHTLLGSMPNKGIWTLGTSPVESMQEFDKELQIRLDKDKEIILPIEEEFRQRIHREVFEKIDRLRESYLK